MKCCCICKTCCCGQNLKDGVFIWAMADILFHILIFPLPLLTAELVFFAPSFDLWLIFLIFADAVLILGEKSGRPAFLTLWLVVFGLNILLLLSFWVILGVSVYLISEGRELLWLTRIDHISDLSSNPFWAFLSIVSILMLVTVPWFHIYFWLVVWSLRKRMSMEIAIGYDMDQGSHS